MLVDDGMVKPIITAWFVEDVVENRKVFVFHIFVSWREIYSKEVIYSCVVFTFISIFHSPLSVVVVYII